MPFRNAVLMAIVTALLPHCRASSAEPIAFHLDRAASISLALYNAEGIQVRTLASAVPYQPGDHTVLWDGLDRQGRPVPAGAYTWRLLETPGLESTYLMSLGTSAKEIHWPGNHNGPAAIAVDLNRGQLYMAAGASELAAQVMKIDIATGKILWSHMPYEGWGHIRDLVFSDTDPQLPGKQYPHGVLYLPHVNSGNLHILDPDTGDAYIGRHALKEVVQQGTVQPLRAALYRFDFGSEQSPVEKGWTRCGLETFSEKRGYGWLSADGLVYSQDRSGDALKSDGVAFPPAGPAKKEHYRSFLINVPDSVSFCDVRLTMKGDVDGLSIYSGLAYGRPNFRPSKKTPLGGYQLVEFETKAKKGKLDITIGYNDKREVPSGFDLRAMEVLVPGERFAAHGGTTLAVFPAANRIQRVSPRDWRPTSDTVVPELRDVAILDNGQILAVSGSRVVLVEEGGDAHRPVIEGLTDPRCLSVDRKSGDLFVAEWGDSHRVKRIDKGYKQLKTFGRKGGRLEGPYDPNNFSFVAGIEGDGTGGFFIVEHFVAPRRLAHFDAAGRVLTEWYGGQLFFTHAAFDPQNKNRLWMDSHFGWLMEVEADWQRGQWRPLATYRYDGLGKGLITTLAGANYWVLRYHEGQRYLLCTKSPTVLKVDEKNRRLVPVVISDQRFADSPEDLYASPAVERKKGKYKSFIWTDANGNGTPEPRETRLSSVAFHGTTWFIDDDFTYYGAGAQRGAADYEIIEMKPQWNHGLPVYPKFEEAKSYRLSVDDGFGSRTGPEARTLPAVKGFYRDGEGASYLLLHGGGDGFTAQGKEAALMGHGYRWPADLIDAVAFAKWDRGGKLLWKVSGLATDRESHIRGRLHFPTKIVGEAYDCVAVGDRIVLPLEAWTKDGLYLDGLFDRRRPDDNLPANCYSWWRVRHDAPGAEEPDDAKSIKNKGVLQYDMNAGRVMATLDRGEVLFLGAGWNNLPAYRVQGFDAVARREGSVTVSQPSQAAAGRGTGLVGEYFTNVQLQGEPVLTTLARDVWFGIEGKKQLSKPWPDHAVTRTSFSCRFTGCLEPRFSETYRFSIYTGLDNSGKSPQPEKVRLWIDGKPVLDCWDVFSEKGKKHRSTLINLEAGRKVPIKLEYATTGASVQSGLLHLCWESPSQPIEHVPGGCLYPAKGKEVVSVAPAGKSSGSANTAENNRRKKAQ
jgi:hypothetical protein